MTGKDIATRDTRPKHTPGPWTDNGHGWLNNPTNGAGIATRIIEAPVWGRIIEVYDYSNEPEYNFQLILAAPELLAALEAALDTLEDVLDMDKHERALRDQCQKAIAKARGTPPAKPEVFKPRAVRINTGCLYDTRGQVITIVFFEEGAYFEDHSRMVNGWVDGAKRTRKVIEVYIKGTYSRHKTETVSWEMRNKIMRDNDLPKEAFHDWSQEYRDIIQGVPDFNQPEPPSVEGEGV